MRVHHFSRFMRGVGLLPSPHSAGRRSQPQQLNSRDTICVTDCREPIVKPHSIGMLVLACISVSPAAADESLSAESIMARVAANQDRSETAKPVYLPATYPRGFQKDQR
jgi:hypothetical protein